MTPAAPAPLVDRPPGWFGKIACLGDFASRRLDAPTRDAWDRWLSARMVAMRTRDGDAWLEKYLRAPIQYWLQSPASEYPREYSREGPREGPSDVGRWHAGTLMPSVDSAGRYFPLVVVQPLARVPTTLRDWVELEARLGLCAQASLGTLADAAPVDRFDAALSAPDAPAAGVTIDSAGSSVASWALATMVSQLVDASLWWTDAGEHRIDERWPGDAG